MRKVSMLALIFFVALSLGTSATETKQLFTQELSVVLLDARTASLLQEQKTVALEEGLQMRVSHTTMIKLGETSFVRLWLEQQISDQPGSPWQVMGSIVAQLEYDDEKRPVVVTVYFDEP